MVARRLPLAGVAIEAAAQGERLDTRLWTGAALVTVMVAERLGSVPVLVMLASALTALIVVTRAFRRLGISAISATRPASP